MAVPRPDSDRNFRRPTALWLRAMDGETFEGVVMEHKDVVHGYAAMVLRDRVEAFVDERSLAAALTGTWTARFRCRPKSCPHMMWRLPRHRQTRTCRDLPISCST